MIGEAARRTFQVLQDACDNHDLALMQCTEVKTGNPVDVICAVNRLPDGGAEFVPLARMFDGNPYDELLPAGAEQQPLPMEVLN
jgi:hypothetical protein